MLQTDGRMDDLLCITTLCIAGCVVVKSLPLCIERSAVIGKIKSWFDSNILHLIQVLYLSILIRFRNFTDLIQRHAIWWKIVTWC